MMDVTMIIWMVAIVVIVLLMTNSYADPEALAVMGGLLLVGAIAVVIIARTNNVDILIVEAANLRILSSNLHEDEVTITTSTATGEINTVTMKQSDMKLDAAAVENIDNLKDYRVKYEKGKAIITQ